MILETRYIKHGLSRWLYKRYTQVFSTYGHKSNDEWLVDYGFVFRNNPVKDVRIKHPSLHPSDAFYKEKLKILSSHGE